MRYPKFLQSGGRIGFIAPSFGCATQPYRIRFETSLANFTREGYELVIGPNAFACEGIGISNTPEKCADEANDFFLNDKSDVIISCGGGELMCEVLPYMEFDKIAKAKPKWFMGYSDNTNFTFMLNTLCDTAAIYGPCAGGYGSREDFFVGYTYITNPVKTGKSQEQIREIADTMYEMSQNAMDLITGKKLTFGNYEKWFTERHVRESMPGENIEETVGEETAENTAEYVTEYTDFTAHDYKQYLYIGDKEVDDLEFSGRLLGGCLDCLANIVGTKFDKVAEFADKYSGDGIVWFLESCELNVMSQARALWNLDNAGWFKHVRAFIIGRPMMFDDTFGDFDHYQAVLHELSKYNVPIIMDADIGHLSPMIPIISGACAKVKAEGNSLCVTYDMN